MNRFADKTFDQYYSELFDQLKFKIASESDDYIISQPTEDLVKYYSSQFLNPVEFDKDSEETLDHRKSIETIYANQRRPCI